VTDVEVVSGPGSVHRLPELVGAPARPVLVVGSRTAFARTGVLALLAAREVAFFTDVNPNPRLPDVLRGCAIADAVRPGLVVGVGGGSAMDVAKMVRGLPADRSAAMDVLSGRALPLNRAPLVLVPTTAGTGSEVTGFATVYVDGVKHSLDHPSVHAELSIVDSTLTETCPPEVTWAGALDALAHAVESTWALRSTASSRALAASALADLVPLPGEPLSTVDRAALCRAATNAGLAIDRTRTTAAHAFAYPLTARFGVRHGVACALNLVWLLPLTAERLRHDCQDPRGERFVRRRLDEIEALLGGGGEAVADLLVRTGFAPWLADHGVTEEDLRGLVSAALGSGRSTNGPIRLDPDAALRALRTRLKER
jgi:alcohol dehydrogenase class IV